jgi:hypothetical protein
VEPIVHHEHWCLAFSFHESLSIRCVIADQMERSFHVFARMYQQWTPYAVLVDVPDVDVVPVCAVVVHGSEAISEVASRWNTILRNGKVLSIQSMACNHR